MHALQLYFRKALRVNPTILLVLFCSESCSGSAMCSNRHIHLTVISLHTLTALLTISLLLDPCGCKYYFVAWKPVVIRQIWKQKQHEVGGSSVHTKSHLDSVDSILCVCVCVCVLLLIIYCFTLELRELLFKFLLAHVCHQVSRIPRQRETATWMLSRPENMRELDFSGRREAVTQH